MKHLLIPGLPLLVIFLALHENQSHPVIATTQLIIIGILYFGVAYIFFYAIARAIRNFYSDN